MLRFCFALFLCFQLSNATAQKVLNNFTDTVNTPGKEIYHLVSSYFDAKRNSKEGAQYWDTAEVKKYMHYDVVGAFECISFSVYASITRIKKISTDSYLLKLANLYYDKDEFSMIDNVTYVVKKKNGSYRLANYLPYATSDWKRFKTGYITFYYPPGYPLNENDAKKSERFLKKVCATFDIPERSLAFYVAKDCDQMHSIVGIESYLEGTDQTTCGCIDDKNDIVYSGGKGFYYPHELVHVVNQYFPNAHSLFLGGISGLYGGHFGKPLSWHQKRIADYIQKHEGEEIDFLSFKLDEHTGPGYVIGGIFCLEAIKQGGISKLKKLFSYGKEDKDFYTAVEKELGITKDKVNDYIIQKLKDNTLFTDYNNF